MNHSEREDVVGKWIITWCILGLLGPIGWVLAPFYFIAFVKEIMK